MAIRIFRKLKAFDRRKYPRLSLNCVAKFTATDTKEKISCLTNLMNLSEGGALVVTFDQKIPANSKVELEFPLPNSKKTIRAEGTVRNTVSRGKRFFESCIQFSNVSREDQSVLNDFVESRLKRKK
jgi:hypothetical protein